MLIVDDDVFASLVETLVAQEERIEVVGRAHEGEEAIRLAQTLAPNVVVMDIQMPLMDGIDATRRLSQMNPAIGVVLCSLLIAEGLSVVEIAQQAGHSPAMMLATDAHVIEELAGTERRPAEAVIRDARDKLVSEPGSTAAAG